MTLLKKVKAVQKVYEELDAEIEKFKTTSVLKCKEGCGECCKKADIEATPIEFLPLAYYLYHQGKALDFWEKIKKTEDPFCALFNPFLSNFGGLCTEYPYRGLICRLFGFSATKDKDGHAKLITCKLIKSEQAEVYQQALETIKSGGNIPVMSDFYMKLYAIDFNLSGKFYPINQAMRMALETVMNYYSYRTKRTG
ncbi:MAG: YkgJ family cysteine cluster protein [Cytophagaceae bacterium]